MKLAGVELPRVLAEALADCRQHFIAAAVFSLLINILYLAPTLYMLQVYDRVVPTGGKTTLLFVTMALALALLTLSILDMVRNRLLIRASQRIDALLAPRILKQMMAKDLEVAPESIGLTDSKIQHALTATGKNGDAEPMQLWQFQKQVRSDPRWMKTQGAQDSILDTMHQALNSLGLTAI